MDSSTVQLLLARYFDTEYKSSFLAKVSAENFKTLCADVFERFEDTFTETDIKEAWKYWFDWATHNGSLISTDICFVNNSKPYEHEELAIIDYVMELACVYIDRL